MKIYSDAYPSTYECAKDAEAKSYQHNEICTIVCNDHDEYTEIVGILQSNEDCTDYVDNDGEMDIWGVRHMQCGNADYRIHVYVKDPMNNRY